MEDGVRFRLREAPVGGARVAFSYLGTLLAAVVAGLLAVMASPLAASACAASEDALCLVGWTFASTILSFVAGFAVTAFAFRLGWEWWAVVAAALLSLPLWAGAVPVSVVVVALALVPALAALATWQGPRRPVWRPWAIGGAAALLAVGGVVSVLL